MLTKSTFKKALACPTKLYYVHHGYPDSNQNDPFLEALAEGGIQVGELAKLRYPTGTEVTHRDKALALAETRRLLASAQDVVIFEGAFLVGQRFARVDVLVKSGNQVQVIEVKSTSIRRDEKPAKRRGQGIVGSWFPYVADVAFQRQLVADALPLAQVSAHLLVMDKSAVAPVNGLNAMFQIKRGPGRQVSCKVDPRVRPADVEPLMRLVDVDPVLADLEVDDVFGKGGARYVAPTFSEFVRQCEDDVVAYADGGAPRETPISKACRSCEFNHPERSGQHACWKRVMGWGAAEFEQPKVWDVWQFRQVDRALAEGRAFLADLDPHELDNEGSYGPRQATQVRGTLSQSPQIDRAGLAAELAKHPAPWHFIDFETTAPAIPFVKGLAPYEGMCFQFSHHVMEADGRVRHANHFLAQEDGKDPSFAFIDALYNALNGVDGTIFRYANHENTYLNLVGKRLQMASPFDAEHTARLIAFIDDLTQDRSSGREGARNMVDLLEIVTAYYWHPRMGASNSIKYVLPAVMESSPALQAKYAAPVYGTPEMPSLNLTAGKVWLQRDPSGQIPSPYSLLPLIDDLMPAGFEATDRLYGAATLGNGGAAMTAYAYLQHAALAPAERSALRSALLQYCELDTLAMVFIWEHFLELAG